MSRADEEHRRAELVTALGALRSRIAAACAVADRDPRTVTLIAVTKSHPAADVEMLARIGVTDIGENRNQEAMAKVAATADQLTDLAALRWHFLGKLQSRKCASIVSYASAVHSLDRPELVPKLADAVAARNRAPLEVFIQVSLDDDPDRGGAAAHSIADIAAAVAARSELQLRGLMAIPPLGSDADTEFARLAELSSTLRALFPQADAISAGMSDDLEAAVKHGSTHVRVGTALLGRREAVFG